MEAKLTLSMDEEVIKKAKEFAKRNHTSLSHIVEDYFYSLTNKEEGIGDNEISPLVKSLSGILQMQENYDRKGDRTDHLEKKYE